MWRLVLCIRCVHELRAVNTSVFLRAPDDSRLRRLILDSKAAAVILRDVASDKTLVARKSNSAEERSSKCLKKIESF